MVLGTDERNIYQYSAYGEVGTCFSFFEALTHQCRAALKTSAKLYQLSHMANHMMDPMG